MTRRVVITGLGTINPLAADVAGYWKALCAGRSGIGPITLFDTSAFKVHFGGEVKGFDPKAVLDSKTARHLDRFAQFGLLAEGIDRFYEIGPGRVLAGLLKRVQRKVDVQNVAA